jgi:single-stranded-DNA-specific exonuclease
LKSGESSWDRMHTSLTGRKYPNPPVGFLNAVFLELEMFVPGKITEFIRSAIGLVAIGTVADVMPLIEENRILVKIGLEELNKKKQTALSLLSRNERINSKTIGWGIAPLLNTPGRVGKTSLTVSFFTENDPDKLQAIITEIIQLNDTRKNTINNLHAKLMNDIEIENMMENEKIIYIKTDEIHDGYAGLMANRIADVTDKPVILVALPGKNGIVKGSCRVKSHINFFSHVKQFSDRFEKIGGHENAFGFTANALHIDDIIQSIKDSFSIDPVRKSDIAIDAELDVDLINVDFIRELEIFEPYGNANPEPVFISRNMEFESCTIFGNNHGKFLLAKNNLLTAIGWGMGLIMKDYYNARRPIDLIYRLENNEYRGSLYPRMIVIDMLYSKK